MEAVLQIAEAEAPGAEIVVMRQPGYIEGHPVPADSAHACQQGGRFLGPAGGGVSCGGLGSDPQPGAPLLGPTTTRDGCNTNAAGVVTLGPDDGQLDRGITHRRVLALAPPVGSG